MGRVRGEYRELINKMEYGNGIGSDVWEYILQIYYADKIQRRWQQYICRKHTLASIVIQRAWLFFFYRGHERGAQWQQLYQHLITINALHVTLQYWNIRREFAREPGSWMYRGDGKAIRDECNASEWGNKTERPYTRRILGRYLLSADR